jgi:DNA mismatch endonuclease (patch repair protein)
MRDTSRTLAGRDDIPSTRHRTVGQPYRPSTTAEISARMSRQGTRDTAPEIALRKELHRRGLRFRVDYPVPGMPRRRVDIMFTRAQVAVLVDGCFWHSCPEHRTPPRSNAAWWSQKLAANTLRDRATDKHLSDLGWTVLRFWEHDPPAIAADVVEQAIRTANSESRHI